MKLKCQLKDAHCPSFKHNGIFHGNNETVKRFLPEMSDLFQIFLIRPLNFLWIDSFGTSRLLILSGLYRNS